MMSALRSSRHSAGMAGCTTSSAASAMSKNSMPVFTPILRNTPVSATTGALPARAPLSIIPGPAVAHPSDSDIVGIAGQKWLLAWYPSPP